MLPNSFLDHKYDENSKWIKEPRCNGIVGMSRKDLAETLCSLSYIFRCFSVYFTRVDKPAWYKFTFLSKISIKTGLQFEHYVRTFFTPQRMSCNIAMCNLHFHQNSVIVPNCYILRLPMKRREGNLQVTNSCDLIHVGLLCLELNLWLVWWEFYRKRVLSIWYGKSSFKVFKVTGLFQQITMQSFTEPC